MTSPGLANKRQAAWINYPFFWLLLPVFFVFHGFVENESFIHFRDCLPLIGEYLGAALVLYLLSWLPVKNKVKAALLSSWVLSFYLFFGAFHDFLRKQAFFLHRYSLLLPLFALLTVLLILVLRKRNTFTRLTLFLNSLLLLYLLVDAGSLLLHTGRGASGKERSVSGNSDYSQPPGTYRDCDTCANPDIYFMIFDEYCASNVLKEVYHHDNGELDSLLVKEGFQIQRHSRSNYSITPFSMASILNLSYLKNIRDPLHIKADDYTNIFEPIRTSEVVHFLFSRGYTIVNNSPFDLPGHPASIDQPFIPTKTKLITNRTLWNYMVRDIGPWFGERFTSPVLWQESLVSKTYRLNQQFLAQTIDESGKRSSKPRFVYTHVLMPHIPFAFDSLLHRVEPERSTRQLSDAEQIPHYLGYLPYTNSRIRELITTIKKNSGGKAVIIFMSDHGLRLSLKDPPDTRLFFANQNAIYFPDRDYRLFYDSMSAVNEFRAVFNKLFRQQIPFLPDSTILLWDQK